MSPIFHKDKDYERLKALIEKSKDVPKKQRVHILNNLRNKEKLTTLFLEDGKKYKNLLATAMFHRAYDIYTSSLLAFLFRNRTSINILLRTQFENMCIVAYYLKNKNEIKNAFRQSINLAEARKYLAEWFADIGMDPKINQEFLDGMYKGISQIVHPFPEGLKFYFEPFHLMTHDKKSPVPVFKPALAVAYHHGYMHDKDTVLEVINIDFVTLVDILVKLTKLDANDEITDYSEIHRKTAQPDKDNNNARD